MDVEQELPHGVDWNGADGRGDQGNSDHDPTPSSKQGIKKKTIDD
jgi:hypothetical protein